MAKVIHHAIKLLVGFPYLIYGFLINQKHDIMLVDDELGVPHNRLNFSYKLCVGKHVSYIGLHNIPHYDEPDLAASEDVLEVPPKYGPVKRHMIKVLMQEFENLQEIIATSNTRKGVMQILISKVVEAIVQYASKDVETLCKNMVSIDKIMRR